MLVKGAKGAYFTTEVNPSSTEPTLKFNDILSEFELTDFVK